MAEAPYSGERRPIAARQWKLSQWVAEELARSGASPNGISVAGAIFGIVGGLAFAATAFWSDWTWLLWLVAAAMMQLRLQCNLYDGMVAIATGRASPVGELYNDVPDRISDSALLIGAGYAVGGNAILRGRRVIDGQEPDSFAGQTGIAVHRNRGIRLRTWRAIL